MEHIKRAEVLYHGRKVGRVALAEDGKYVFQYNENWLADGFSISPLKMPLNDSIFVENKLDFDGMFGVFADSLPDGWGRLLVDRMLRAQGVDPHELNQVERLCIVGTSGMGALEYIPEIMKTEISKYTELSKLSDICMDILAEKEVAPQEGLEELFIREGSSGGARPKVMLHADGREYLVKFPAAGDNINIGEQEEKYMMCASACGIDVPDHRLFESGGRKFFGSVRFDRKNEKKIHMVTVSGLFETTHRLPNLDYADLLKLTDYLTKDREQIEEMIRRMCFNSYAHNWDDHSKNFTYLFDEKTMRWSLSPAYDLTYSFSTGGERATTINGNGRIPSFEDLYKVSAPYGFTKTEVKRVAEKIEETILRFI